MVQLHINNIIFINIFYDRFIQSVILKEEIKKHFSFNYLIIEINNLFHNNILFEHKNNYIICSK